MKHRLLVASDVQLAVLLEAIHKAHGLAAESPCFLSYVDEDEDRIPISTDNDLEAALTQVQAGQTFRVFVRYTEINNSSDLSEHEISSCLLQANLGMKEEKRSDNDKDGNICDKNENENIGVEILPNLIQEFGNVVNDSIKQVVNLFNTALPIGNTQKEKDKEEDKTEQDKHENIPIKPFIEYFPLIFFIFSRIFLMFHIPFIFFIALMIRLHQHHIPHRLIHYAFFRLKKYNQQHQIWIRNHPQQFRMHHHHFRQYWW
ncbi:MAG: hypothetical protein EZS28_033648 [Streblomastix strix]|uniref:PB1 domain-containing protein n=1 Tax=Streblomastix strix TaxID=222440 RepID=A0A5J4UM71_9EUKA|nr:MAG: hypothetical protein EZS28_033648 [Streblomastix strix]